MRIAVTGATSGIGRALAETLAARGDRVVLLCRDVAKMETLRVDLDAEAVRCDLADLASVREAADTIASGGPLHALVNNAGTYTPVREETPDGHERMFQVHVLGPFLLTTLLEPCLRASGEARVANLAGLYHRHGTLVLDDLDWRSRPWDAGAANADSQLHRVLFTFELAARWPWAHVNAVHPGAIRTSAQDAAPWFLRLMADTVLKPVFKPPEVGAHAVLTALESGGTGVWFRRTHPDVPHALAEDPRARRALWDAAETATR
ncbi:MAG: SDR family NAD(P)-dependent oxidoreductase [Alphaproteobacteria bacterium]|nr:SDR family NAD(P)-dependent oxidoreductase [Alphaproteobacteria bacterium]